MKIHMGIANISLKLKKKKNIPEDISLLYKEKKKLNIYKTWFKFNYASFH